ncbi:MAG TPA: carboxypeptidase-like regulatory domain-containing protein, partial [Chitinophagaceae bacterium]
MKKFLFLFLVLASATSLWGQQDVTGRVTDARDGSSLSGVNVVVKGTKTGTTTDKDGRFRISAPANATLVFSNVSFEDQEFAAGSSPVNVSLKQAQTNLQEVVVTGYSTQNKRQV